MAYEPYEITHHEIQETLGEFILDLRQMQQKANRIFLLGQVDKAPCTLGQLAELKGLALNFGLVEERVLQVLLEEFT